MNVHERLRRLRKELGLSARAFGASIDMSGSAIANMETGQRNVTDRTIRDICRVYHVNPEWLMRGEEPMFEDVLAGLDVDEEVKQLALQYGLLSDGDRELIRRLIDSLAEKRK